MDVKTFRVYRREDRLRWEVALNDNVYGAYLDREQAVLDAMDAASDSCQSGSEAQVWVRDHATASRLL